MQQKATITIRCNISLSKSHAEITVPLEKWNGLTDNQKAIYLYDFEKYVIDNSLSTKLEIIDD